MIIVTGFVSNGNNRKDRDITHYIDWGKLLINNNMESYYKVIFIERNIFNEFFIQDNINYYSFLDYEYVIYNKNIFVLFERENNYLYNYKHKITDFYLNSGNDEKNTIDYIFIQCHKTEWVKIAIQLVEKLKVMKDNNNEYMWIDFGIYSLFNNDINLFNDTLTNLHERYSINSNNKVHIASCVPPHTNYYTEFYRNIAWYFAGSVFGGPANKLLEFTELMKTECINIIEEKHHLMWEVNVWFLIFAKHPDLFDLYKCNHNPTIISNY